ncbi:MAG: class II aldolase/adducin family protein [Dehalococcoidia bacterium]|nr:class II aldolase/adducin family protein [Dehalococcoidia bacterium]MYD51591.1 class II aldolase/adducin family protein [Dehalococcoidia bacterium]
MPYTPGLSSELVKFSWEQISPTPPSNAKTRPLCAACDELDALDLLASYAPGNPVGSNGNVSVRASMDGAMIVTATQLPNKRRLQPNDFVVLDRYTFAPDDENVSRAYYSGSKLPSSESILHWYFYRKHSHINAIVHVHENTELLYSSASLAAWEGLGVIETARYGDAGTVDLPQSVEEVIENLGQYVILKDHWPEWDKAHTGTVVFGESLDEAVNRAVEVHEGLRSAARTFDAP